jgi:hypothetical protein
VEAVSLIPDTTALDQAKVAPVVPLVAVYVNMLPLQIEGGVKLLEKVGIGFTLTSTS